MAETSVTVSDNRQEQAKKLAQDIMSLSRSQLLVSFRFLDRTISRIRLVPHEDVTFATDGRNLYYSPWFVLQLYMTEQTVTARNLLHSMLHCVFRHPFIGKEIHRSAWDLAADIAVENAITGLQRDAVRARREEEQADLLGRLSGVLPVLSAERIYHYLEENGIPEPVLLSWRLPFVGDDHAGWYQEGYAKEGLAPDADLEKLWEEAAKRMQTELEVVMGSDDALTQNLRDINRTRYNYTEFLRRFARRGETMRLSEEEFDVNYYTYGLELYGNVPLIEPLEYRDEKKIREMVIAIDTSGSVKGEVVQKFVQHTHDILTRTDSFEEKTELYIIQCDDRIEDVAHITSPGEFDRYLGTMEIRGLGETDFRPVFAYVDELIKNKKLTDLKGLLYFTDGKGIFPSAKPDYETAFILSDDGLRDVWTPEWASKIYLAEEEILDERFGK